LSTLVSESVTRPFLPSPLLPSPLAPSRLNIVIGFASAPGKVALEPEGGRNGFFTAALLTHIRVHGHNTDVAFLLRFVRSSVVEESRGAQDPWLSAALTDGTVLILEPEGETATPVGVRPFPGAVMPEVFVGRGDALARLLGDSPSASGAGTALGPVAVSTPSNGRLSVISGLGGIGKSALARELCRQARRRVLYPAGIFWVDADSRATLDKGLRDIATRAALNRHARRDTDQAAKPEEVREAVMQWLSTNPGWMLVMDNADDLAVVKPYVLRAIAAEGGHVVLTSRANREAFAAHGLLPADSLVEDVGVLSAEDAIAMLVSVQDNRSIRPDDAIECLGGEGSGDVVAVRWLVGQDGVQGLALALQQAAAYVRGLKVSWAEYVRRFKSQQVEMFGPAPAILSPWEEVVAWLAGHELDDCGAVLQDIGVTKLSYLVDVLESDLATSSLPPLRRRRLWRTLCEGGGHFSSDQTTARRCVRTTWALSLALLRSVPDLGAAAVEALQLCSYAAPDGIPFELVVRAGLLLPAGLPLRTYLAGCDRTPAERGDDWAPCALSLRRVEELVALLASHNLVVINCCQDDDGPPPSFSMHRLLQVCIADDSSRDPELVSKHLDALRKCLTGGIRHYWGARSDAWQLNVRIAEQWCVHSLWVSNGSHGFKSATSLEESEAAQLEELLHATIQCLTGVGRVEEAHALTDARLTLLQRLWGNVDNKRVAAGLGNLGRSLQTLGRLEEALPQLQASVDMKKRLACGLDDSSVATGLGQLGGLLHAMGRLGDALPLLQESVSMLQRLHWQDGSKDLAVGMHYLALLLQEMGQLKEALPVLQASVEMKKRLWGEKDHPEIAAGMSRLGGLLQALGRLEDALLLLQASVDMRKRLWGDRDHSDVATGLHSLGGLLHWVDWRTLCRCCRRVWTCRGG
jgi:tetratricopeptide (TPR) repeat protein